MINGTIIKGIGGFYYIPTDQGIVECRARGKLRKQKIIPMVGDEVMITIINQNPLEGAIEEILPRKNFLIRPTVANVDCVVIVIASSSPNPDYFMIDKLIVTAEKANIDIVIAVNKTDLTSADEVDNIYSSVGYPVIPMCANNGFGIDNLKSYIKGRVTAFAGNSGVGKSSILNYFGFDLQTGIVSKINRGKHTTRHVELMPIENNRFVIDTPGFSLLEINDINESELKNYFKEFKKYEDMCRFKGCDHIGAKSKDCAVINALEIGEINESRYISYKTLYDTLKNIKEWD